MIIYVSYCARDVALVEPLVVQLGLLGHSVQFEYKTLLGELSWEAVAAGIRACDVFLLALTSNSIVSYARGAEHQYAAALGKSLITARLDAVEGQIPSAITNIVNLRELNEESIARLSWALDSLPPTKSPSLPLPTLEWSRMLQQLSDQIALGYNSIQQQDAILLNIEEFLQRRETFDSAEAMLAVFGARAELFEPIRLRFDAVVNELAHARRRRERGRRRAVLAGGILLSCIVAAILLLRLRDANRAQAPLSVDSLSTAAGTETSTVAATLPLVNVTATLPLTNTPIPATATPQPSSTPIPATVTLPLTNTPIPMTATPQPSSTLLPPSATSLPPSSTPVSTLTGRSLRGVLGESVYVGLTVEDGTNGIVVTAVGATAAAAGVQTGDIIRAVDLQDVATADQFYRLLNARNPFARVNLRLRRAGGIVFATMTLGVNDYAVPTPQPQ